MKKTTAAIAAALLLGAPAFAADSEQFFGWSKDGSWFAWQRVSGPNDLTELYFCATDDSVQPSWPAGLNDAERSKVERQSCVTFTDPNRAPFGWKAQLSLPKPAMSMGKMRVLSELVPDGENPGFVVEERIDKEHEKKTVCYVTGLRESSKLQTVWWHSSGRWVAALVDGHVTHCNQPLKPQDPQKPEKKPKTGKK